MITVRISADRGYADHGWLKSHHTFSFADYRDPAHMGFASLRVINEDFIAGGGGFATHPHRDMEIISYVVSGGLEHKDSMGNSSKILPGEVQRMSAGTGVEHSEFNHFADKTTHLLQIWFHPERKGIEPGYEQKSFAQELAKGKLVLVASRDGRDGSVRLHQDVDMYVLKSPIPDTQQAGGLLASNHAPRTGMTDSHKLNIGNRRKIWLQVIRGSVKADSESLGAGDGARIENAASLNLQWSENSEFIIFDMV